MHKPYSTYKGLLESPETLPAHYYWDAAHYQRELNAIWYQNWVYVCRAEKLQAVRSFRTIEIGSQNIIILRDDAGDLQAFHNTCRHRGSILCTEEAGQLRSASIICPYHAWTYSLQGDLKRVSSRHCTDDFDKKNYPLYEVAVAEWKGFIFINLKGTDAVPLAESFQKDSHDLTHWPMEELKLGHSYRKTMACNWKIFWENFNECLHCAGVHPELCQLVPIYRRGYMEAEDDPQWPDHADSTDPKYTGGVRQDAQSWTFDGRAVEKPFDQLSEKEREAGHHYVVNRPSIFIAAHVDYVRIVRLLPLGPQETELKVEWLFAEKTLKNPSFDVEKTAGFAKLVMQQDAMVAEFNQRGMRSIAHKNGVLMAEEYDVHDFQNWVREQLLHT